MLDRKIVINELRKRGYIAEEKNVVKNGVLCDGISIHLPETKMENEKVQSVFGVIYMDTLEEMKEMENLSFEQVVERIIEVVWKNSPKLNDFPKNDKEVLKKITIGFQRTEYNSNMLKRKSDFDGIENCASHSRYFSDELDAQNFYQNGNKCLSYSYAYGILFL